MNRRLWIAILILITCAAFAIFWDFESRRPRSTPAEAPGHPDGSGQSTRALAPNAEVLDDRCHTVRTLDFEPVKTLYMVEWQVCPAGIDGGRVLVLDANFQKVFFEYEHDEILRVEKVELRDNYVPQLLIVTGSSGTDDEINWHILGEVNGELREWTWPDYDAGAQELLRADEDFCCKSWNFHLRGQEIAASRGIYRKDTDGNCCPSRGGVLVWLQPFHGGFKLVSIQRIGRQEYYRWRSQPWCLECTLASP